MLINLIIWLSYSKRKMNQIKYRNKLELKHVKATTSDGASERIILRKQLNDWDQEAIKYRNRIYWYIIILCVLELIVSIISENLLTDVFNNMSDSNLYISQLTRLLSIGLGNVTNIITTILLLIYLRNDKLEKFE